MRTIRCTVAAALVAISLLVAPPPASANLIRGLMYVVGGVLEIPRSVLVGTVQFPVVGTVLGALSGTVRGVGMVARGTLEIAGSALPLAKKLAPLIPFVF